jgi:tRNA A37 methylthiotransferase MiaB
MDITKKHYMKMVGQTVNVLFTQKQSRKDQAWMGRDYGCKRILIDCQDDLSGMVLDVHVLRSTGMTLIAESSVV